MNGEMASGRVCILCVRVYASSMKGMGGEFERIKKRSNKCTSRRQLYIVPNAAAENHFRRSEGNLSSAYIYICIIYSNPEVQFIAV